MNNPLEQENEDLTNTVKGHYKSILQQYAMVYRQSDSDKLLTIDDAFRIVTLNDTHDIVFINDNGIDIRIKQYKYDLGLGGYDAMTSNDRVFANGDCIFEYTADMNRVGRIIAEDYGIIDWYITSIPYGKTRNLKPNAIICSFKYGKNLYDERIKQQIQSKEQEQINNEKSEIASKIKAKHRRQQLEKIVRQELIESGELFGDQPQRPLIPREVVDAIYSRDGGKCVYCGAIENLQLDHIIPFSKGGATSLENLQILCQKCNLDKSNKIG